MVMRECIGDFSDFGALPSIVGTFQKAAVEGSKAALEAASGAGVSKATEVVRRDPRVKEAEKKAIEKTAKGQIGETVYKYKLPIALGILTLIGAVIFLAGKRKR